MSNLTEKDIELARDAMQLGYRQHGHEGDCEWVNQLCDMAKRTLDEETTRKIAVRRAEKAEQRAQRAEAECERIRGETIEECAAAVENANDHGGHGWAGKEQAEMMCVLQEHYAETIRALATPPPEGEPCHVPPIVNNTPDGKPDEIPDTPEQAHGDALVALDRVGCEDFNAGQGTPLRIDKAFDDEFAVIRQALTASGVPESVRELPAEWENGTEGMTDSAAAAYRCCARALRFALASTPAARDWLALLEREDWGLVPISVPTGGDDYDVEWTVIEYHMAEPKERVIGRGPTPRDALIAASPQRGG